MTHEKIFSRPDGTRIKIVASLYIGYIGQADIKWSYFVLCCEPKKRTWKAVVDEGDYAYRKLSMEDRKKKLKEEYLKIATKQEVLATELELWEKLKPSM